jgi:hypothetical protein
LTRILEEIGGSLGPLDRAQLLQRRAAASLASQCSLEAANDLLHASRLYLERGHPADGEACALAAASVLAEVDAAAAERVISEISATVPADGAAATRRGLVGGRVAMQSGAASLALQRFDEARQGALDVADPISYFAAAVEASHAAEALGEPRTAYARLVTAWASLSDILGREDAARLVRPALEGLRDRLGAQRFVAAKREYESERGRGGAKRGG